jgi:rsbT co-antagonist protein RsbR
MVRSLTNWLGTVELADPVQRRQAVTLQAMLIVILGACAIGLPLGLLTGSQGGNVRMTLVAYPTIALCTLASFVLLRNGRFDDAVLLSAAGILVALTGSLVATGMRTAGMSLLAFCVPIAQAGLLLGRRGLLLIGGGSGAIVVAIGLLETFAPGVVGLSPSAPQSALSIVPTFILVMGVLVLLIDRFGSSLRDALHDALVREEELNQIRATLETAVTQRTVSLEEALRAVEQREASLVETLRELRASQETVRELSAPVVPVLPGVLVAPLVGALDSARAADLSANVLAQVERRDARFVVLDITGVPVVDTHVAQVLLGVAQAVRLLGARTLLVGIRPEVAQTIVSLGVDLTALETFPDLQEAVGSILAGATAPRM